ncbi:MAG TPA: MgtC/SapB family protein [Acidimicrobiales bacterium]|jgi:putative Mg2+ transporter-C (MgtC) family protein
MWAATSFTLDSDVVVRLLAAAVLGGLVGVEREASDQPAGLRTHIAVALGAGLFGVISTLGFLEFDQVRANSTVQVDVSRVASNVVVGIGFLGAGVIFRQGGNVRNLTTAASLWTVAAIGLACGVGDVATGALATVVLLGSLVLLRPLRRVIGRHTNTSTTVAVELRPGVPSDEVVELFEADGTVATSELALRKDHGRMVLVSSVTGPPHEVRRWVSRLAARPEIESVSEE